MRATSDAAADNGIGIALDAGLILWIVYWLFQHFRQDTSSLATYSLPLWLYRVRKHDRTVLTDGLLYLGLYAVVNGLPTFQDLVGSLVPAWVLEERHVETQIFGMISALATLAGIVVYRGEDPREKSEESFNWFMVPVLAMSIASCLWLNDVRSTQDLLHLAIPQWLLEGRPMELRTMSVLVLLAGLAGIIVWRGDEKPHIRFAERASHDPEEYPLPPALIPGRTTHTRLFPAKHSFDYSYLSVGVPVGWTGCAGSVLSCDVDHLPSSKRRRGWFDISARDYLSRDGKGCLEHKLANYLHKQGVSDDDWSFAYLVTAPKFLHYSFNPVSFWYIYDNLTRLTMMILEVNNTFDERRLYLLKPDGDSNSSDDYFPPTILKFTNSWQKDFHVSPFNDRRGTYTLTAIDPLAKFKANTNTKSPIIDNTIILKDPTGATKLVARVFSSSLLPATSLSAPQRLRFLATWFWTGFATFPRILRQAAALYFKHNLPVFFKPEPLPTSIGRAATAEESAIEPFFRAWLHNLVSSSPTQLRILYQPPEGMGGAKRHIFVSKGATAVDEADDADVAIKTVSPAFYSRFVHFALASQALEEEGMCEDQRNRSVVLEGEEVLRDLFAAADADVGEAAGSSAVKKDRGRLGPLERVRWAFLAASRCAPPTVSYPPSTAGSDRPGTTTSSLSPLDVFVRTMCEDAKVYRRAVSRVFLATRYTGGLTPLLTMSDVALRAVLVGLGVGFGGVWAGCAVHIWSLITGL